MKNLDADTWYEVCMKSRADALTDRFGPTSPPDQVFKPQDEQWEMRIPGFAFLRYAPSKGRGFWLYITHGLAQPCDMKSYQDGLEDELSGFGVEFAFATATEEAWPFSLLEMLAEYALQGTKPILPLDRIPSTDLMEESLGGHLLALQDPGYYTEIETCSGAFHIVHLTGVTSREIASAKKCEGAIGSAILEAVLHQTGLGCVTARSRPCLTDRADFSDIWQTCKDDIMPPGSNRKKPFWKLW